MTNFATPARITAAIFFVALLASCDGGRPETIIPEATRIADQLCNHDWDNEGEDEDEDDIATSLVADDEIVTSFVADNYTRYVVKDPQKSAAFIDTHDFDGDGFQEIVLSTLIERGEGPPSPGHRGALRIFYSETKTLAGPWKEEFVISLDEPQGFPFINTPQVADVDGDGDGDIIVQTGFLTTAGGAHFWQECEDGNRTCNVRDIAEIPGQASKRHYFDDQRTTITNSDGYYWHESGQADLNCDGMMDIVTTSSNDTNNENIPAGYRVEWYRQTTQGQFEYEEIVSGLGGVFIKLHDVDGDNDTDIVLSQFFQPPDDASLLWLENVQTPPVDNTCTNEWVRHDIDNTIGLGYHLEFINIDDDPDVELVAGNHNNDGDPRWRDDDGNVVVPSGMYIFEIPSDLLNATQWERRTIAEDFRVTLAYTNPASQGVPGIFNVGDIDNNGLPDVALPGDGNDCLYGLMQQPGGTWVTEEIAAAKQFGMAIVTDIDGDGSNEIVAAQHNSLDGKEQEGEPFFPDGMISIYKRN